MNNLDHLLSKLAGFARSRSHRLLESNRIVKRGVAFVVDSLAIIAGVVIAYWLRLGSWPGFAEGPRIFAGVAFVFTFVVFTALGLYKNIFRYYGARGLIQLTRAIIVVAIALIIAFSFRYIEGIPRTIPVIFSTVLFFLVASSRILARYVFFDLLRTNERRRRVVIYGAGESGRQLAGSLSHDSGYTLIGHVDDDERLHDHRIEGVRIFPAAELEAMVKRRQVDIVFLAMPRLARSKRAEIVNRMKALEVQVLTLPNIADLVSGQVSLSDLREIEIGDLLARDPVEPDQALLRSTITDRTVLITGAGGSIGSELCRQVIALAPRRLVMFEMSEAAMFAIDSELRETLSNMGTRVDIVPELGSMGDCATVERLFKRWQPETVFHAAAYKHVPLVEANIVAGVRNNVVGSLNLALAAERWRVEDFILISTDKAVRPTNVMGASKRICELVLQALNARGSETKFAMVRFGNVLGSSGSVVPRFRRQIANGGPVTVTHRDMTRYFMTIPEAATLVIQAGAMAEGGEVYLLDMGEPVKIWDLAEAMIKLSGLSVRNEKNPDGDIEVVEVGLRSGEKLYEELLIDSEAVATRHPRIFRATEAFLPWSVLSGELEKLKCALDTADRQEIGLILNKLVDGFAYVGNHPCPMEDEDVVCTEDYEPPLRRKFSKPSA